MDKFFTGFKKLLFSLPGRGFMSAMLFVSTVFTLFSSLPPLFTYTSSGRLKGIAVLLFGLAFTLLLYGTGGVVFYLALVFFATVVLGEFINSRLDFAKTLIAASVLIVGTYVTVVMLYSIAMPINLKDLLISNVSNTVGAIELASPDIINSLIKETGKTKTEIVIALAAMLPGYVFMGVVIFLFLNLLVVSRFHLHLRDFLLEGNLKKLSMPEWVVWPALAFSALYMYSSSSYNNSFYIEMAGSFLFKGIMIFYFLQGLAIAHLFTQYHIKTAFLRNVVLSLMVVMANVFITAVGFFDTWFNFRKFLKKGEEQ